MNHPILVGLIVLVVIFTGCALSRDAQQSQEASAVRANVPSPAVPYTIPNVWILYLVAGLAIILGPALAYFMREVRLGVALVIGGAGCVAFLALLQSFINRYPWAMRIPFGVATGLGVWMFISWWKGLQAKVALRKIVPAVEKFPAAKAYIKASAGNAISQVRAAVDSAKRAEGISLGDGK